MKYLIISMVFVLSVFLTLYYFIKPNIVEIHTTEQFLHEIQDPGKKVLILVNGIYLDGNDIVVPENITVEAHIGSVICGPGSMTIEAAERFGIIDIFGSIDGVAGGGSVSDFYYDKKGGENGKLNRN